MVINILNIKNIMMKRNLYCLLLSSIMIVYMTSCMEIDNFDEPDARVSGRLIDATTGENYLTDQGETHIRIWEMSYSTNPTPQDLAVKSDGTYNNEKLFRGTYDMIPYNGSYWPIEDAVRVGIGKKGAVQDFTVTPYLKIKDFNVELGGIDPSDSDFRLLKLSCRLFAPITSDLPMVMEVWPFLSLNQFCGNANRIDYYDKDRITIRKSWDQIGDMTSGEGRQTYTITVSVKPGYTYNVRMGANVNDTHKKFNYSEMVKIEIPSAE